MQNLFWEISAISTGNVEGAGGHRGVTNSHKRLSVSLGSGEGQQRHEMQHFCT